jgi:TonB family protein
VARGQEESGVSFAAPLQITMSTVTADAGLVYESLTVPRRGDRALWLAFAISLLLHAAAVALLPGLRVPEPRQNVLTIELQPAPRPEVERRAAPRKEPARPLEKPFERQELEATAAPAPLPEPIKIDPRTDVVAATRRVEPSIGRRPNVAEPVPVMRAEPRPLPDVQPVPQQRVERAPVAPAPSRPEPIVEQRAEVRPEPRMETRVEPRLQAIEPRPVSKVEQRVEPVATPRPQPAPQPQREQVAVAQPRSEAAPLPKTEAAPTVARVERQPELKAQPRAEPVIAAPPRPSVEVTQPQPAQVLPRPESPAERKPEPLADARQELKPEVPPSPAQLPRAQVRAEPSRNELQAVAPAPLPAPQAGVERWLEPTVTVPAQRAPEPPAQARAPAVTPLPSEARPQTVPNPAAPTVTAAIPSVPKRNKAEEAAAISRFAHEISGALRKAVSKRDYPPLARDRRWQGTTQLTLHIHPDGRLGDASVANSSGYEVLDQRALELVKKLELPAVPPEIQSRAFAVGVSVRFTLPD